jgi:molecular chaperone GrpE
MPIKNEGLFVKGEDRKEQEPAAFQVIDKRHFLDLDKLGTEPAHEERPRYPTFVEELLARVEVTEQRFEERKKQMQEEIARTKGRLEAEFQRRIEIERQKILLPFLEVLDNLERALGATAQAGDIESFHQGVEMIASLFYSKLIAQGVESIPVLNKPFDPNLGQAVGTVAVSDPSQDGLVLDEVQKGYRMGEQLLRPAQVRVGRLQEN